MIFLSHASGDRDLAEAVDTIVKVLKPDEPTFYSAEIPFKADWYAEITAALQESAMLIALVTPESLQRGWVHFECGWFAAHGKSIMPIMYNCDTSEMARYSYLGGIQGFALEDLNVMSAPRLFAKLLSSIDGTAPHPSRQAIGVCLQIYEDFREGRLKSIIRDSGQISDSLLDRSASEIDEVEHYVRPMSLTDELLNVSGISESSFEVERPRTLDYICKTLVLDLLRTRAYLSVHTIQRAILNDVEVQGLLDEEPSAEVHDRSEFMSLFNRTLKDLKRSGFIELNGDTVTITNRGERWRRGELG